MKLFSKYQNAQEYCWLNSSNTLFCKCYDNPGDLKVLKIVFKNGRTYLYKDVDVNDYIAFRDAESNGSAFAKYIRKYTATRIQDTDLNKLEELKQSFINEEQKVGDTTVSNLGYVIEFCDKTGEFVLKLNDKVIYSGIEGEVSIVNLFRSMGISCSLKAVDGITNETDENELKLDIE